MRFIACSLLVACSALAREPHPNDGRLSLSRHPGAVFRLTPNLTQMGDLCSLFSEELTGSAFCLKGDGARTGTQSVTSSGSPINQSSTTSTGQVVSSVRFDGTDDHFDTGNTGLGSGDFSVCSTFRVDNASTYQFLAARWHETTAADRAFYFAVTGNGAIEAQIVKSGGATTTITGSNGGILPGAIHTACVVYDFVTDGTSTLRLYLDNGTQVASSTTAVGPPTGSTTVPFRIGWPGPGTAYRFRGNLFNLFFTEKALSADVVSRMHRVARGVVLGTWGETVNAGRATARTCLTNSEGTTLSKLTSGQICVQPKGLNLSRATTNQAIRSEQFDSSWTLGGCSGAPNPTVTANAGTALDGTLSADRVDFPSVTGSQCTVIYQSFSATADPYTFGVWVQGVSGSGTIWVMATPDGSTYRRARCDFTSDKPTRCNVTGTYSAATWYTQIGIDLRDTSQSAVGAQSVYLWGGQRTQSSSPLPYCPTAGTSAQCDADIPTMALPVDIKARGCIHACIELADSTGSFYLQTTGGGTISHIYKNGNDSSVYNYDGSTLINVAGSFSDNTKRCFKAQWGPWGRKLWNLSTGTTVSAGSYAASGIAATGFQVSPGGFGSNVTITDLVVGSNEGACR